MSPEHHEIHSGGAYVFSSVMTSLAAGSITYIEIVTASVGTGIETSIQNYEIICDQPIKLDIIEAPTLTDGSAIHMHQRNRRLASAPVTSLFVAPTSVSGGEVMGSFVFGGSSGLLGLSGLRPTSADLLGFNLNFNTKYILTLTNISATACAVTALSFFIFEIQRTVG